MRLTSKVYSVSPDELRKLITLPNDERISKIDIDVHNYLHITTNVYEISPVSTLKSDIK